MKPLGEEHDTFCQRYGVANSLQSCTEPASTAQTEEVTRLRHLVRKQQGIVMLDLSLRHKHCKHFKIEIGPAFVGVEWRFPYGVRCTGVTGRAEGD